MLHLMVSVVLSIIDETRLTSMYTYLVCALDSLDAGVIQTIVNGW